MKWMLCGAKSFDRKLGREWTTCTADMRGMFDNDCLGSIAGRTNDNGTPE